MARQTNKQVEIFNFSFLDILACTIGALTFILVLVIVSAINQVASDADVKELLDAVAKAKQELQVVEATNADLEREVSGLVARERRARVQVEESRELLALSQRQSQEAKERMVIAQQQAEKADQRLNELRPELRALNESLATLEPRAEAEEKSVARMNQEATQRASEFQQLSRAALDREQLLADVARLESENQRLPDQIAKLKEETEVATAENQRTRDEYEAARRRKPRILARLDALESDQERTARERDALVAAGAELAEGRRAGLATLRAHWFAWTLALVVSLAVIALCVFLLIRLAKLARPLHQLQQRLDAAEARRNELKQQVARSERASAEMPESIEDAMARRSERLAELEQEAEETVRNITADQAQARELESQCARESEELTRLTQESQRAKQEARKRATPVSFRVPLLRETTKDLITFECHGNHIARITTTGGLDEKNFKIDLVKSAMLTRELKSTTVVLERKRSGEPMKDLRRPGSEVTKQVMQINPQRNFLFAVVRPSGFESFRMLREQAWDNRIDVGWQPMAESLPLISCESGGRSPGIQ